MILKSAVDKKIEKKTKLKNFLITYFISTVSILIIFIILFFTSYTVKLKTQKALEYLTKAGRIEYIYIFNIVYKALKSNFYKVERIDLDIKFDDVIILENEREIAIKKGSLGVKDNLSKVPVILKYKDKEFKSRIRLKGDRKIHYEIKKDSSYNIYLPKGKTVLGANNFAIQKPGVRNYIHEWIFTEMVGDLGLIKQKYEFFDLYINGSESGLYVLEEKMGKEILERNARVNGPIFTTNGDYYKNGISEIFQVYNDKFWKKDENFYLANTARYKLSEFFKGNSPAKDIFDMEKFAAFFAIMDATYTIHALFDNSKLYYNPESELFEPVPRDGHRQLPNYHKLNINYYDKVFLDSIYKPESSIELGGNLQINEGRQWWLKKFFTHENGEINYDFYKLYLRYITKITSEKYLNEFFDSRKNEIERINSLINSDSFFYSTSKGYTWGLYYFKKKDLFHRANVIRSRLETADKYINAIIDKDKNLIINVAYNYYNKEKNLKRLDDLVINSVNCIKKENLESAEDLNEITLEKKIINKTVDIFLNKKIKLNQFDFNKLNCSSITILDNKLKKTYIVKIDKLNSF